MSIPVQSIITRTVGNFLNDLGRFFDICCLEGQIRRTSLNRLAKKQIYVLKVLLTEPGDIPSISERKFVNRPNLSRTRVKTNS